MMRKKLLLLFCFNLILRWELNYIQKEPILAKDFHDFTMTNKRVCKYRFLYTSFLKDNCNMESAPKAPQVKIPDLPLPSLATTKAAGFPPSGALESTALRETRVKLDGVSSRRSRALSRQDSVGENSDGKIPFTLQHHCELAFRKYEESLGSSNSVESFTCFQDLITWMEGRNTPESTPYRISKLIPPHNVRLFSLLDRL